MAIPIYWGPQDQPTFEQTNLPDWVTPQMYDKLYSAWRVKHPNQKFDLAQSLLDQGGAAQPGGAPPGWSPGGSMTFPGITGGINVPGGLGETPSFQGGATVGGGENEPGPLPLPAPGGGENEPGTPESEPIPPAAAYDFWADFADILGSAGYAAGDIEKMKTYVGGTGHFRVPKFAQDMMTMAKLMRELGDDTSASQLAMQAVFQGLQQPKFNMGMFNPLFQQWGMNYAAPSSGSTSGGTSMQNLLQGLGLG